MVSERPRLAFVTAALLAAVALSYAGVLDNGFIDFDDPQYLTDNAVVRRGLTPAGLAWAFTTTEAANWHPLTWVSHMADVELFGLDPRGHHAVGLLLHAANACLLLFALKGLTGSLWRSAAVAALFALHPLHVESVAWAAERKDVLSTLLFLLALLAYARHARRPGRARLALVAAALAAGLLAKPMLVTLPFVLLLLDFWPLGRFRPGDRGAGRTPWPRTAAGLVVEKIPLFLLAAASSAVTYHAQGRSGAIDSGHALAVRASNAATAYAGYLGKMLWPRDLSFFYPHPGSMRPAPETAAALAVLAAISVLSIAGLHRRPYLSVGWFWYLGTLVPVIGLVQVGSQAMADRYTYIPLTGLFVLAVWQAADLAGGLRFREAGLAVVAAATLLPLGLATHRQVARWRDTETLTASVPMGLNNWVARLLSGNRHAAAGRLDEAIADYREALRLHPAYDTAYYNLGNALSRKGLREEAVAAFRQALHLKPDNVDAHVNLGVELAQAGDLEGAVRHFGLALSIRPDLAEARANLEMAQRQLRLRRAAGR